MRFDPLLSLVLVRLLVLLVAIPIGGQLVNHLLEGESS